MLYCPGAACPLRMDCYRHTQPAPGRDRFAALPLDEAAGRCDWFVPNQPDEAQIREAAYYIWLREGRPAGRADQHWEAAYRSLCASMGRAPEAYER